MKPWTVVLCHQITTPRSSEAPGIPSSVKCLEMKMLNNCDILHFKDSFILTYYKPPFIWMQGVLQHQSIEVFSLQNIVQKNDRQKILISSCLISFYGHLLVMFYILLSLLYCLCCLFNFSWIEIYLVLFSKIAPFSSQYSTCTCTLNKKSIHSCKIGKYTEHMQQ